MLQLLRELAKNRNAHPVLEDATGVVCAEDLLARVDALAGQFSKVGANVVGLLCHNSVDWVAVDLASQSAATCLVPIPTFFSDAQIQHVLNTACVDTLIFDPQSQCRVTALHGAANDQPLHGAVALQMRRLTVVGAARMPPETAKLTFTSGSTGNPKGVCLSSSQCDLVAQSLAQAVGERAPRHLCVLPLSTLLENIGGVYMPLISGGTSLVYPLECLGMSGSSGLQPERFLGAITQLAPNTLILVPQLLAVLDSALANGWRVPSCLRFVAVGGGRVAPAVVKRVRARGLPVYEGYGLSECASVVALNTPEFDRPGTSGRVLPHVNVSQRDGELVVHGNACLGYLNEPQSWREQAVQTGDLGSVSQDGFVTVAGRRKNVLVSSFGRNISPEWVESELLATGVFTQAMLLGDDRPFCSALLLPADSSVDDETIQSTINSVNAILPDYAQVARWLRLQEPFSLASGTLTENGRLRRENICQRLGREIERLYFCAIQEPVAS